jgi:hypothetical protein
MHNYVSEGASRMELQHAQVVGTTGAMFGSVRAYTKKTSGVLLDLSLRPIALLRTGTCQ